MSTETKASEAEMQALNTEDIQRANEQLKRESCDCQQAFEALQQSEERLRLAFDAANAAIWDWDIANNTFFWSDRLCQFLGLESEALPTSYKKIYRLVHPLDRFRLTQALQKHWKFNLPFRVELRMQKADGSYGWFLSQGKAVLDSSQRPTRMVGLLSDISYRKPAEKKLKPIEVRLVEAEKLTHIGYWKLNWKLDLATQKITGSDEVGRIFGLDLEQLYSTYSVAVDNLPYTFAIYDADRRLQFVNMRGIESGGYREQELLGHRDEEVFPPEITNSYLPILKRAVESCLPQSAECTITLSMDKFTFIVNYIPLLDARGKIYQIIGIIHNITERKLAEETLQIYLNELEIREQERAEELIRINESLEVEIKICATAQVALWQSQERLEDTSILLQNVLEMLLPMGVWIADANGRIWQGNRAAQRIWGGAKYVGPDRYDEYKGWWADTGKRLEASEWAIARAIAFGESSVNEVIDIEGFDGTRKTILNSGIPLRNQKSEIIGAIAVHQDITEQRLVEKALWNNQHLIQRISDAIPDLFYLYDLVAQRTIYVEGDITDIISYSQEKFQQIREISISANASKIPRARSCNLHSIENHYNSLIHPDDIPKITEHNQRLAVAKDGEICEIVYRIRNRYDEWRWLSSRDIVFARNADALPDQILGTSTDITDRKHAEETLRESEQRFRIMADTTPILIWMAGTDGQCNFFNKPWLDFTGRTLEEEMVNAWEVGLHPEDLQRSLDIYLAAFHARLRFQMEYRLRRFDGEYRWLLDTGMPLFSAGGDFIGYIGSAIDISDRKTAEQALLASEENFRQLAENIQEAFWITLPDLSKVIYVSPVYEKIWGRSSEGLYANPKLWLDTIYPEDRDRVTVNLLNNSCTEFEIEYRIVQPDGSVRWIWDRSFPIRDRAGDVYRRAGVSLDISDRKQTQEALRISEERLRIAILNSPIALFNQDLELRYTWILNPPLEFSVEMMLGKTEAEILWPQNADRLSEIKRRAISSGIGAREEVQINNNEETFYYDLTVEPLRDSAGCTVGITCAAVDVSDRKYAEESRNALEREKQLSKLQLRFFSMASHEFRTPLATILLSAQVLETCNHPGFEEKRLRNIHRLQNSARNMTHLLEDILTITRAETDKLEFNPKPLHLEKFCRKLAEDMPVDTIPNRTINFVCTSSAEPEAIARSNSTIIGCVDENLLRSILANLLSNAIKYSPQGGQIDFTLVRQSEAVIFRIQDRGIGISKKDRKHLFEAFQRGENVGNIPGSGLGLTVVKKCVELHNGSIKVTSEVGVGTTFTVTIPLGNW